MISMILRSGGSMLASSGVAVLVTAMVAGGCSDGSRGVGSAGNAVRSDCSLVIAQLAHNRFLKASEYGYVYQLGFPTGSTGADAKSYLEGLETPVWYWQIWPLGQSYVIHLQLEPSWARDEPSAVNEPQAEMNGQYRWQGHTVRVYDFSSGSSVQRFRQRLGRHLREARGQDTVDTSSGDRQQQTETLLLAQEVHWRMIHAINDPRTHIVNYGFAPQEDAGDIPVGLIEPEDGRPVWLWKLWESDDTGACVGAGVLVEVWPDGQRVRHSGVARMIDASGAQCAGEYTWEGHGIRLYACGSSVFVDKAVGRFSRYFNERDADDL